MESEKEVDVARSSGTRVLLLIAVIALFSYGTWIRFNQKGPEFVPVHFGASLREGRRVVLRDLVNTSTIASQEGVVADIRTGYSELEAHFEDLSHCSPVVIEDMPSYVVVRLCRAVFVVDRAGRIQLIMKDDQFEQHGEALVESAFRD